MDIATGRMKRTEKTLKESSLTEKLEKQPAPPAYESAGTEAGKTPLPFPESESEGSNPEIRGFLLAMGAILTCLEINGFLLE